ncbi:hypothetical protein QBC37DRAFT_461263 [Rhypophila decipiens]|uniref:Uncharacterized protein n=1 Tax=Rhypophila decipiens TaxID=261697 RepID=A0AAN7B8E4_9PEZI|nr:hypothetical protein QBC37DRAFT_461263 [Rhypophila decipiens]
MVQGPDDQFGIFCPDPKGSFIVCDNANGSFLGCVSNDQVPCNAKIGGHVDHKYLLPSSFDKAKYAGIPVQDCDHPSGSQLWYVCQNNKVPFMGCCKSNPCNGNGCPSDDLIPAKLSSFPPNRAPFLVYEGDNAGTTTTGTTSSAAGPSSTASSAAATPTHTTAPTGQSGGVSGAMIGGILGGVAALVIFGAVVFWKMRKRQQAGATRASTPDNMAGLPENGDPGVFDSGYYRGARRSNLTGEASTSPIPLTPATANRYSGVKTSMGSPPSSPPASPQPYFAYPGASGQSQSPQHPPPAYPFAQLSPRGYEPVATQQEYVAELDSTPIYAELPGSPGPAPASPTSNQGHGQYQALPDTYNTPYQGTETSSSVPHALVPGQGAQMARNF